MWLTSLLSLDHDASTSPNVQEVCGGKYIITTEKGSIEEITFFPYVCNLLFIRMSQRKCELRMM